MGFKQTMASLQAKLTQLVSMKPLDFGPDSLRSYTKSLKEITDETYEEAVVYFYFRHVHGMNEQDAAEVAKHLDPTLPKSTNEILAHAMQSASSDGIHLESGWQAIKQTLASQFNAQLTEWRLSDIAHTVEQLIESGDLKLVDKFTEPNLLGEYEEPYQTRDIPDLPRSMQTEKSWLPPQDLDQALRPPVRPAPAPQVYPNYGVNYQEPMTPTGASVQTYNAWNHDEQAMRDQGIEDPYYDLADDDLDGVPNYRDKVDNRYFSDIPEAPPLDVSDLQDYDEATNLDDYSLYMQ